MNYMVRKHLARIMGRIILAMIIEYHMHYHQTSILAEINQDTNDQTHRFA